MNQTELKVFYPTYFPSVNAECQRFPTLHPTKKCPFPGLLVEILTLLAHDCQLKIVPSTYLTMGYVEESVSVGFDELEQMMLNGSLDVLAMGFQDTERRRSLFEFSEVMYFVRTRLLRQHRVQSFIQMWSFFKTYDRNTWIAFAAAVLAQWIFFVLVRRFEAYKLKQKPTSVLDCAWVVIRLQLLQPEKIDFQCICGLFSCLVYSLLQCSILLGVFGSFILVSIIRPLPYISDPIAGLVQSIKLGNHYMVTDDSLNWFNERINSSELFPYAELRSALKSNPRKIVRTRDEALNLVANDNGVMFQQTDVGSYYRMSNYCNILAIEDNMPLVSSSLMLRPNHPLLPKLNRAIVGNRPRIRGIVHKYLTLAEWKNKCSDPKAFTTLSLAPYTGVIIVASGLFGFAFLVFGTEIAIKQL
ncbi:hypothetical protein M3Y98_01227900 [Aphelenchoides besseyi]|nr:hypothetical protein M3Y98_01227900 [Aphelenchoides besseyi]KAI6193415.1 hypothetical protein M3Y96_01015300 [Aphelenchoides besseyi]